MEYDYKPAFVTPERHAEIEATAAALRDDAAHDIEDKRAIYEALIDLLAVARIEYYEE